VHGATALRPSCPSGRLTQGTGATYHVEPQGVDRLISEPVRQSEASSSFAGAGATARYRRIDRRSHGHHASVRTLTQRLIMHSNARAWGAWPACPCISDFSIRRAPRNVNPSSVPDRPPTVHGGWRVLRDTGSRRQVDIAQIQIREGQAGPQPRLGDPGRSSISRLSSEPRAVLSPSCSAVKSYGNRVVPCSRSV
jgi:hypothetical protein